MSDRQHHIRRMLHGFFVGTSLGLLELVGDDGIKPVAQRRFAPGLPDIRPQVIHVAGVQHAAIDVQPLAGRYSTSLNLIREEHSPGYAAFVIRRADLVGWDAQLLHARGGVFVEPVCPTAAEIDSVFGGGPWAASRSWLLKRLLHRRDIRPAWVILHSLTQVLNEIANRA